MKPEPLSLRAARYFGAQDRPRVGFKVGRAGYVMVVKYDRKTILHYNEEYGRPRGTFIKLTDRQRALLIDALQDEEATT
jgi:hypothetical protein